jgi:hypothetical protein
MMRKRKEVRKMSKMNIIYSYSLDQAIEDGVLVEMFKKRWKELSNGKPIVATVRIAEELSQAALIEIWNEYVGWRKTIGPTSPEEERLFKTMMNGKTIWVLEDGAAFTLLYPADY